MNGSLLSQFQASLARAHAPRMQRVIVDARRVMHSKALQLLTRVVNRSIRARAPLFWGDTMIVVIPEHVSASILRYGFIEEGLTTFILEYLEPGMVFFDVGAHLGYFTLLASRLVATDGAVHAFEPTPKTFALLRANVGGRQNICAQNIAIWSDTKILPFNDFGTEFSAFNSMYTPRGGETWRTRVETKTHHVQAMSIDYYIAQSGVVPNFIKIDAESAEYQILLGMDETFRKYRPILSVEVGDVNIAGAARSRDVIEYVLEKQYRALEYADGHIVEHQLREQYEYDNILLVPRGAGAPRQSN